MGRRGRSTITNRITQYFDEGDPRREIYAEVCDAGWRGMLDHTLEIWYGPFQTDEGEIVDFGFRRANTN